MPSILSESAAPRLSGGNMCGMPDVVGFWRCLQTKKIPGQTNLSQDLCSEHLSFRDQLEASRVYRMLTEKPNPLLRLGFR